jgi:hypothetical protein
VQSVCAAAEVTRSNIAWFVVTLGAVGVATDRYADITVAPRDAGGVELLDSVLALYTSAGVPVAVDDDGGRVQQAMLTFGMGIPARPCQGCNKPRNGADISPAVTLAPGVYYVALGGYPMEAGPGAFGAFNGEFADVGGATVCLQTAGRDDALIAQATALPATNCGFSPTLITAAPYAAGGADVNISLTSIGLDPVVAMRDDGEEGDQTGGDGVYSLMVFVPNFVSPGTYELPVSVADTSATLPAVLRIDACPSLGIGLEIGDAGEGTAALAAQRMTGDGPLMAIAGELLAGDVDVYEVAVCDPSSFRATTIGGAAFDSQLFLFAPDGRGIVMSDDSEQVTSQSLITSQFIADGGVYLLAVTEFDNDPVDFDGLALWADAPFHIERAPDGDSQTSLLASWVRPFPTRGGRYLIMLEGACFVPPPATCNPCPADYNADGGVDGGDIEAFFTDWSLGGGELGCADTNADGGVDGADIEAFFSVWMMGGC